MPTCAGSTILPHSAVRARLEQGRLRAHKVVRPVLLRHLVAVSHSHRPVAPPAAALMDVLVRHLRQRG